MKKKKKNADYVKKINDLLDLPEIDPPNKPEEVLKYNKTMIQNLLKNSKATKVVITYNGGGDEGHIDDVKIYAGKKEIEVKGVEVEYYTVSGEWTGNSFKREMQKTKMGLATALETFAEQCLDDIGYDWVNNEGGFGDIEFDVKGGKVLVKHNQRIESSEYSEHSF